MMMTKAQRRMWQREARKRLARKKAKLPPTRHQVPARPAADPRLRTADRLGYCHPVNRQAAAMLRRGK